MKKTTIVSIVALLLLFSGCGHNVLTDYEVKGLDVSFPVGGYPFGVRIGKVKVNANMVRGNATYSSHSNSGSQVSSGASETSQVIQFSSNSQVNEGNIKKIITDKGLEKDVKETFIKEYLTVQSAPEVMAVTSKTPIAVTSSGNDYRLHKSELKNQPALTGLFRKSNWLTKLLASIIDTLVLSVAGKVVIIVARVIACFIVFLFAFDIVKKTVNFFKRKKQQ